MHSDGMRSSGRGGRCFEIREGLGISRFHLFDRALRNVVVEHRIVWLRARLEGVVQNLHFVVLHVVGGDWKHSVAFGGDFINIELSLALGGFNT